MKTVVYTAVFLLACSPRAPLCAQVPGFGDLISGTEQRGVQLYNVTASSTYYSMGLPDSISLLPNGANLSSDVGLGLSASLGWARASRQSSIAITYSPAYMGRLRYTDWNALNHSLSISANRKFGQKWSVQVSANGAVSTADNFLFTPTVMSRLTSIPVSFDDLAAAVLTGNYNNNQLASILTGAPLIESPARMLLFGYRGLISALQGSVSYQPSSRLTVTGGVGANRFQHLSSKADPGYNYLIPQMTTGSANLTVSYALSPRTQIGTSVSSSRTYSALQDAYMHSINGYFGRTMGRRWFIQLHGGAGIYDTIRTMYALPGGVHYLAGSSLTYKTFAHTFMGAYDRSLGTTNGWGAGSTTAVTGSWTWQRPGRNWGVFASAGWQELTGFLWARTDAWRGSGGFSHALGSHAAVQLGYSYMSYSAPSSAASYSLAQSAVRAAIVWSPNPAVHSR